jgi:hypothetical protein
LPEDFLAAMTGLSPDVDYPGNAREKVAGE